MNRPPPKRDPPPTPALPLLDRLKQVWNDFGRLTVRLVLGVLVIFVVVLFIVWALWVNLYGWWFYVNEYLRAVMGYDTLVEPCIYVLRDRHWVFRYQIDREDYYRYNRCRGNENGFPILFWTVVETIRNPFGYPLYLVRTLQ